MSIVLITGNEPYRIKCEINRIKKEFGDLGVAEYDELSEDVFSECSQCGLFAAKKAVIVHLSGIPDSSGFSAYAKHPSELTDLYLVADDLDKRSAIYKICKKGEYNTRLLVLDKVSQEKFVSVCAGMISKRGCVVRESTLKQFYDYTGYGTNDDCNLFEISVVIKQMCYQAGDSGEITPEMIAMFATPGEDAVVWQLSDVLFAGDRKSLFTLGEKLLRDGESPIAMLSALLRQFRLAYKAKVVGGSEKELSSKLGVQAFRLRKALACSEDVLSEALGKLQKRVNEIKNGQEPTAIFRMTLMETLLLLQGQAV